MSLLKKLFPLMGLWGLGSLPLQAFDDPSSYAPGQLIMKLQEGSSLQQLQSLGTIERLDPAIRFTTGGTYLIRLNQRGLVQQDLKETAEELKSAYNAQWVEPNYYYYLNQVPNDSRFSELYGLQNNGQTGGTKGADIKAVDAWKISTGSHDILVGITDTGIDYEHADLKANVYVNPGETGVDDEGNDKSTNGIDDDANGYVDDFRGWDFINNDNDPMDDHGHGSHCAGTIGGVGDNEVGVAGVNWQVSLVAMKVFNRSGSTTTDALTKAIYYNSLLGVHVSSNSWGGGPFSQAMFDAISDNRDHNILFVAAAGNNGRDTDQSVNYPSGYELDNIVSVAATDHNDRLAYFSNYGIKSVDVAAPGVNILSAKPGGGYQKMSGTSMSAPHVSGLAALIWSVFPDDDFAAIRSRVISSADPIEPLKGKVATGRVNAFSALATETEPTDPPSEENSL